jgi:hypothetical protein
LKQKNNNMKSYYKGSKALLAFIAFAITFGCHPRIKSNEASSISQKDSLSFHFFKETPKDSIEAMNKEFFRLRNNYNRDILADSPNVVKDSNQVISYLSSSANPNPKYLIAVLGLDQNKKLTIDGWPSDATGTTCLSLPDSIKNRHRALKTMLDNLKSKPPYFFNLDDFPLLIKMETKGFHRLHNTLHPKVFLFYACVQNGFKNGDDPTRKHYRHFSVGILASEHNSNAVNSHHSKKFTEKDAVDGEETWPEENFVWYTDSSKDFILQSQ